jgi:hypothetical protein
VRSYSHWDSPYALIGRYEIQINSLRGYLYIGLSRLPREYPSTWLWNSYGEGHFMENGAASKLVIWEFDWQAGAMGFGAMETGNYRFIYVPYWFLILFSSLLAAAAWIRWQFSLRTLLLATTLVAVVLGWVVYATKHHS